MHGCRAGRGIRFVDDKIMKLPWLAILLFSVLAGCATAANYDKVLASWVGKSEDELTRAWGQPSAIDETGGKKYLTYDKNEQRYFPGTPTLYQPTVVGTTVFVQPIEGTPGATYNFQCKTTFELAGGKVVSSRWEGRGCMAK
jgi:hypothetical protein